MTGLTKKLEVQPAQLTHYYANHMCPKCSSTDITGGFVEIGEDCAVQEVSCSGCHSKWKNVYDFAAVFLIDEDIVIEVGPDGTAVAPETKSEPVEEQATYGQRLGR